MYTKYNVNCYIEKNKRSKEEIYLKANSCRHKLPETRPLLPKRQEFSRFPHTEKILKPSSLFASCSQHSSSPLYATTNMMIIITSTLRKWLTGRGLKGFIQVAEAPAHPNVLEL